MVFQPKSFDLGEGDTLAVGGGGFANVLGSLKRGTLIAEETRRGLQIGLTDDTTETAARIISDNKVAPMYARPILDLEQSKFTTTGGVRTFTLAKVRAILIKTDRHHRGTLGGGGGAQEAAGMAVTITAQEFAAEVAAGLDRAERILAVATAEVLEYAPNAPDAVANEAVIRLGGYLAQSDYGTVREESIGPRSVSYQMNHAAMFRNSGAQALLTRYKRRRAGAV